MTLLKNYKYSKSIRAWLLIGLVMLIGQVVLGGITRLTGSGLSITSWDIITGVIPPFNRQQWMEAFEQYQQTPQFQKINSTFTLRNFKTIYFWEYFHRLWVRTLGVIFLLPFIVFSIQKKNRSILDQTTCNCCCFNRFNSFSRLDYGSKRFDRQTLGRCIQINTTFYSCNFNSCSHGKNHC